MTAGQATDARYPTGLAQEAWAYVSGLCVARECEFLPARAIDEIASLPPADVPARLARTFLGAVDPLSAFDVVARKRLARELEDIFAASPSGLPVDLVRLGPASDRMRAGLADLPSRLDAAELMRELVRLSIRSGDFADDFADTFDGRWPDPGTDARTAAALAIDSAELQIIARLAALSGDAVIQSWAEYRVGEGAARVAQRSLALHIPREIVAGFFYRGLLSTPKAQDFVSEFNERTALAMYPPGVTGENVEERMLAVTAGSIGEPSSAGRVLHYLNEFIDQIVRLRLAIYRSTGRVVKEAA